MNTQYGQQSKFTMTQAWGYDNRYMTIPDISSSDNFRLNWETKHDVRHYIRDMEYKNFFISKPILRPECGTL